MQSRRLTASQITHLKERRRILEDLNLHQHYCEVLRPRREGDFYTRSAYSRENSIMTATPLSSLPLLHHLFIRNLFTLFQ